MCRDSNTYEFKISKEMTDSDTYIKFITDMLHLKKEFPTINIVLNDKNELSIYGAIGYGIRMSNLHLQVGVMYDIGIDIIKDQDDNPLIEFTKISYTLRAIKKYSSTRIGSY